MGLALWMSRGWGTVRRLPAQAIDDDKH